jgi:hypothetical protein
MTIKKESDFSYEEEFVHDCIKITSGFRGKYVFD